MGRRIETTGLNLQEYLKKVRLEAEALIRRGITNSLQADEVSSLEVYRNAHHLLTIGAAEALRSAGSILSELGYDEFTDKEKERLAQRYHKLGTLTIKDLAQALYERIRDTEPPTVLIERKAHLADKFFLDPESLTDAEYDEFTELITQDFSQQLTVYEQIKEAIGTIKELADLCVEKGFSISLEVVAADVFEGLISPQAIIQKAQVIKAEAIAEEEPVDSTEKGKFVPHVTIVVIRQLAHLEQGQLVHWDQYEIARNMLTTPTPTEEDIKGAFKYLSVIKAEFYNKFLQKLNPALPLAEALTPEYIGRFTPEHQSLLTELATTWGHLTHLEFKSAVLTRFNNYLPEGWVWLDEMKNPPDLEQLTFGQDYRLVPKGVQVSLHLEQVEAKVNRKIENRRAIEHQDTREVIERVLQLDETGDFIFKTHQDIADSVPDRSWRDNKMALITNAKNNFIKNLETLIPSYKTGDDVLMIDVLEKLVLKDEAYQPLFEHILKYYSKLTFNEFKYGVIQNFHGRKNQDWDTEIEDEKEIEAIKDQLGLGSHYRVIRDRSGKKAKEVLLLTPEAAHLVQVAKRTPSKDSRKTTFASRLKEAIERQRSLSREVANLDPATLTWDGNRGLSAFLMHGDVDESLLTDINNYLKNAHYKFQSLEDLAKHKKVAIMPEYVKDDIYRWLEYQILDDGDQGDRHSVSQDYAQRMTDEHAGRKEAKRIVELIIRVLTSRSPYLLETLEKYFLAKTFDKYTYKLFFAIVLLMADNTIILNKIDQEKHAYFNGN